MALLGVASMMIAGCGGSAKPTATTGCKGLSTARRSASFNSSAGDELLTRHSTISTVCAHFGQPTTITRASDGSVTWNYGGGGRAAMVSFKGGRVVDAVWFEQGAPDATYSISQSETVTTFSGGDKLHPFGEPSHCSSAGQGDSRRRQGLPGTQGLCK